MLNLKLVQFLLKSLFKIQNDLIIICKKNLINKAIQNDIQQNFITTKKKKLILIKIKNRNNNNFKIY